MNTDNMSLDGITIDFGPYGFLEYYDEGFICNHSDNDGRYSYGNQAEMAKWNLDKLSETFVHFGDNKILKSYNENNFWKFYDESYYNKMA